MLLYQATGVFASCAI